MTKSSRIHPATIALQCTDPALPVDDGNLAVGSTTLAKPREERRG
jgi:hypothetical protein